MAQLRHNPKRALDEVEGGETYVVTKHRRPTAQLVPVYVEPLLVIPAKNPGPSDLAPRQARHTYEETEALLAEMSSEW